MIPKFKKNPLSLVCRACRDESIDIITHCTLINIHASLFAQIFLSFRPKFRKLIWNLKKAFHYYVELDKTNPLLYNIKYLG